MRASLQQLIDRVRTGFWFVPSLMIFLAVGLSLVLLSVDRRIDPGINGPLVWAYSGGPEGARSLLSTIAGSMITAASVTFSLASVSISIASQQYGSRVLRNFMRDRVTQVVLGTFVSTFVYSVLVVRTIRGSDFSGGFVPAISITGSIVLSLLSLIVLVYFVHHIATSIQASEIISVISADLKASIPVLYPGQECDAKVPPPDLRNARSLPKELISKDQSGYIQSIDLESLMKIATRSEVMIEVAIKPGDHTIRGTDLAIMWGGNKMSADDRKEIANAFGIGARRTPLQDVRFQFQQLTDVVVRALSPGINDPFTAINGIDALTSAASQLARRPRAPEVRYDASGAARLLVVVAEVEDVLQDTVEMIACYASDNPFVMQSLRRLLTVIEPDLKGPSEHGALERLRNDLAGTKTGGALRRVGAPLA